MIIEFLTFDIDPEIREQWLDVDERTWTKFLRQQAGFVSKQMWVEQDNPGQVHAVIVWTDEATWKLVSAEESAQIDATMGEWLREPAMRVFDVARST